MAESGGFILVFLSDISTNEESVMRKCSSSLLGLIILLEPLAVFAADGARFSERIIVERSARAEFRLALNNHFAEKFEGDPEGQQNLQQRQGMKSVPKAVFFSAAIPGGGQIYNGSRLKAIAFLAVEVAGLVSHFRFQNRGSDLEARFESDADRLWDEDSYWTWMSEIEFRKTGREVKLDPNDPSDLKDLRVYERMSFSHFLPEEKGQQYYENVGKYDQFVTGWQDFREQTLRDSLALLTMVDYSSGFYKGEDLTTISEQRNAYVGLRRDANDNFKRATNMATLVIFNHIVSAFDAGLTAKRRNQVLMKANIGMRGKIHNQEIVPVLNLGLQW